MKMQVKRLKAKSKIDSMIERISDEFSVTVMVRESFQPDYGECYPDIGQIILSSRFSNKYIKFAVFLHELCHIITLRRHGRRYLAASVFQEEFSVWDLAQELHYQYLEKPFTKSQVKFMLKCLCSYSEYRSSFRKKFNKDVIRGAFPRLIS